MEAKHRLFRWLVALPLMTGTMAYFNWLLYDAGLFRIEMAAMVTMSAMWLSWAIYGGLATNNRWEDWEDSIR